MTEPLMEMRVQITSVEAVISLIEGVNLSGLTNAELVELGNTCDRKRMTCKAELVKRRSKNANQGGNLGQQ